MRKVFLETAIPVAIRSVDKYWICVGLLALYFAILSRPGQEQTVKHHNVTLDNSVSMAPMNTHQSGINRNNTATFTSEKNDGQRNNTILIHVASGQNLANVLKRNGLSNTEIYHIEQLVSPYLSPHLLPVGHNISLRFVEENLQRIELDWEFAKRLSVSRLQGGWDLNIIDLPTVRGEYFVDVKITGSLYKSAREQGVPVDVIKQIMSIYGRKVDFYKDLRRGDTFSVLYSELSLMENSKVRRLDQVDYAELNLSGKSIPLFRYHSSSGTAQFYDPKGQSSEGRFLNSPIPGAKISSFFGRRLHPVLGYYRPHKGVDFSAPTNTRIIATGDGIIEKISTVGTFGKHIKIRHGHRYHTLYAHLNHFVSGLKQGDSVKQGQIIAYLGNSGLSAYRHLHYEVHKNGKAIDPLSLDETTMQLKGDELSRFIGIKRITRLRVQQHSLNSTARHHDAYLAYKS